MIWCRCPRAPRSKSLTSGRTSSGCKSTVGKCHTLSFGCAVCCRLSFPLLFVLCYFCWCGFGGCLRVAGGISFGITTQTPTNSPTQPGSSNSNLVNSVTFPNLGRACGPLLHIAHSSHNSGVQTRFNSSYQNSQRFPYLRPCCHAA